MEKKEFSVPESQLPENHKNLSVKSEMVDNSNLIKEAQRSSIAIILTSATNPELPSIESGLVDGKIHFDHHGDHSHEPCPAKDARIQPITEGEIQVSHIDADTYVGLLRMLGQTLPNVDFELLEEIDLNGSSICSDVLNPTLLYMRGVSALAKDQQIPRASENRVDITEKISEMLTKTDEEIMAIAKAETEKAEHAYQECQKGIEGKTGLWVLTKDQPVMDPSRPYQDGFELVVVYREQFQTVSVYAKPGTKYDIGGMTLAGVLFEGHAKACGSPRKEGFEMTPADAERVFRYLSSWKFQVKHTLRKWTKKLKNLFQK